MEDGALVSGAIRDITKRKRAGSALRAMAGCSLFGRFVDCELPDMDVYAVTGGEIRSAAAVLERALHQRASTRVGSNA
jgi:hypothetical protein